MAGTAGRSTSAPARSSTRSAAVARRRSCCSTGAAGRTSSPAGCAAACGSAPNCDVTLVYHQAAGEVACHHCGHRERCPEHCPDCASVSVARHGTGTEQLERELEALVSPLPVFRLDSDVAAAAGVASVLSRFERARRGVLVGTQMVAKGHDFPDVTLGWCSTPTPRCASPTSGPRSAPSRWSPSWPGAAAAAPRRPRDRPGARARRASAAPRRRARLRAASSPASSPRREAFGYPPHGHLIRVVCSSTEAGPDHAAADAVRELIEAAGVPALGPAPLFRRQGRHRAQLVIRWRERERAVAAVRDAVEQVAAARTRSASFAVDVDPQ